MASRKIKTWRDPYDMGFSTTRAKEVEINSGITVLVGCNGAGKTTLLENIKEVLQAEKIPMQTYNNEYDGGSDSFSMYFNSDDLSTAASIFTSSEGEKIGINVGNVLSKTRHFLKTGKYVKDKRYENLLNAFRQSDGEEKEEKVSNERWILLDAVDSGYSIDNAIDLKAIFHLILEDSKKLGVDTYIVVSANAFELASGNPCMDVQTGKYVTFKDYDDYRKFILKTRERKEKRLEKLNEKEN